MSSLIRSPLSLLLVSLALLALSTPHGAVTAPIDPIDPSTCELAVLSDPEDPYYPLAREIAATESAPLAQDLAEALACRPAFLLWVTSTASLPDAAMVEFGLAMKAQTSAISSGIITASTLEGARELWERRSLGRSEVLIAANALNPSAHIDSGRLPFPLKIASAGNVWPGNQPLTKEAPVLSIVNVLRCHVLHQKPI
jgi:hypothetical protein